MTFRLPWPASPASIWSSSIRPKALFLRGVGFQRRRTFRAAYFYARPYTLESDQALAQTFPDHDVWVIEPDKTRTR